MSISFTVNSALMYCSPGVGFDDFLSTLEDALSLLLRQTEVFTAKAEFKK
jgi:hypothetical protein